jgi:hypothetical protein
MRLPRPRPTIRWMMIVVAVAALLMGGAVGVQRLPHRRATFLSRATYHEGKVRFYWHMRGMDSRARRLRIDYHGAMSRKYRAAALKPWLPVEPDPPEPQ